MPSPQHTLLCSYRYDPLDRLISHSQLHMQMGQRFYCKSRLATEIQGAIEHSIFQHDDLLLAQQQRQDAALDTTLLATDLQRSVLHTLKHNHQRQSIAHSPYGHRPAESGLLSLLGFNGERPDPLTGHYLLGNGYRAFNPVLMRFNSPDNLSPFGWGGLNPYAYCDGEPVLGSDAKGHWKLNSLWKGIKNFFGRTPSKLRTPAPSNAPSSANLASTPVSSNAARRYSSASNNTSSSSLGEHSMQHKIPRRELDMDMDMFKLKPEPPVRQKYGRATQKKVLQARGTSSPKPPSQRNGIISQRQSQQLQTLYPIKNGEKYPSFLILERDLRTIHAVINPGIEFNISHYAEIIRSEGF